MEALSSRCHCVINMCSLVQAEKWDGNKGNEVKGSDGKIKKIKEWAGAVG